jgi:hypothetical protein
MAHQMRQTTETLYLVPTDEPVTLTGEADNIFLPHVSDDCQLP